MKLLWGVVVLLLLAACIQFVPEETNETTYSSEVINVTAANFTEVPKNITKTPKVSLTADILNETNSSNSITGSAVEEEVFEDLTIGAAHKMIPALEEAVRNASCYNLTWNGFAEQQQKRPLEVKKVMRFNYMGGRLFKGWIASTVSINNDMIDSQTVEVLVEFMQVTCLDTENFTIYWAEKLKKYEH